MVITFNNCDVPAWKLRKGVVVGYNYDNKIRYAHLVSFYYYEDSDEVFLCISKNDDHRAVVAARNLMWLEPHD